jgi:hypothetical protein
MRLARNFMLRKFIAVFLMTLCLPSTATLAARAQGCPDLHRNMDLINESDRYLRDNPESHRFKIDSVDRIGFPSVGFARTRDSNRTNDYSPNEPVREVNYLTKPLLSLDDLTDAQKEAESLEKKGMKKMASHIRVRIQEASSSIYGEPLDSTKLVCISVAEELRKRAWSCEKRALYPMAAKLYQQVIDIYAKEIGNKPKTAGVMADLARVFAENSELDKAKTTYAQTLRVYEQRPNLVDDEYAAFLETYSGFLERTGSRAAGTELMKRAVRVRIASSKMIRPPTKTNVNKPIKVLESSHQENGR